MNTFPKKGAVSAIKPQPSFKKKRSALKRLLKQMIAAQTGGPGFKRRAAYRRE